MIKAYKQIFILVCATTCLSACEPETGNSASDNDTLIDFEEAQVPSSIVLKNADAEIIKENDNSELQVKLKSKIHHTASIEFLPETPWDFSNEGDFALALDIRNALSQGTHLYITATDGGGATHNRSFYVPATSDKTYYMELKGADLNIETGIRSNPVSWKSADEAITWRWGTKNLDLSSVKSVSITVRGLLHDRELFLDNLRVLPAPDKDPSYLKALVDRYGQSNSVDFETKVHSDEELIANSKKEMASLRKTPFEGRSKFGGWLAGPKLEATGHFRVAKHNGKWSLVDPEGYLFFSHGIANIRMANTSTITGYDFDPSTVKQRSADDLTPEDSLGLNRVSDEAAKTRYISSELRANMFTWLPTYDESLGQHFGYRRSVHTGAIERGETYSFYQANLERKFGIQDVDKITEQWRDLTVDRMLSWGFTSFGNWVDPMFYQLNRLPYFANGWIIGDFKTVSSGNDYWSPLPDPFDPTFAERARITVQQISDEVKNNPWCVGVFIDNEKSWGAMGSIESQYGIVLNTLTLQTSESPTKAEFSKYLKNKYTSVGAFNDAWGTDISDWGGLDNGITVTNFSDTVVSDFSELLYLYAAKYFEVVSSSVKDIMPGYLYLGARFADWGMTPEIRQAAANHADVVSYNYYKEGIHPEFWSFLEGLDKPSIIGEFHMGAMDTGLLNPGLIHRATQKERAVAYTEYMESVVSNPYLVGAHWFQYTDSPLTGRAYDGENYNVGFVNVTDTPYPDMVRAAKAFNTDVYDKRFH